jgi:hypothetical protein
MTNQDIRAAYEASVEFVKEAAGLERAALNAFRGKAGFKYLRPDEAMQLRGLANGVRGTPTFDLPGANLRTNRDHYNRIVGAVNDYKAAKRGAPQMAKLDHISARGDDVVAMRRKAIQAARSGDTAPHAAYVAARDKLRTDGRAFSMEKRQAKKDVSGLLGRFGARS